MNYSSKVDEYNKQVHGIEKKDYSECVTPPDILHASHTLPPPTLAIEVCHAVPHQLDRNGENQKAKNLVDGSDRIGSQPPHQRPS